MNTPAQNSVKITHSSECLEISRDEAESLVEWMQHEWIPYDGHGLVVRGFLKRLQKFVYSHSSSNKVGE